MIDLGAFRMLHVDIGTDTLLKVRLPKETVLREGTSSRFRPTRAMLYRDGQPALDLASSEWFGV